MLELQNISYGVEQDGDSKNILRDISLTIDERFVAITGPNGGGKSTLAKVIAGILTPTQGRILLDGEDITGLDITQRAQKGISFAFQQPVRFKGLTVKDLITLASGKQIGVPEACGYLSEVGLCAKDYIDREVDASLSGGELKRIEIAMIMARGTKLSVFDEPEAGIDLWSFSNLIQVFEHLHEKINGSIIIISHQERILDIADRIIVLADGRIQTQGTRMRCCPSCWERSRACAAPCRKKCGKEGAERWTRSRKACWSRWPGSTRCPRGPITSGQTARRRPETLPPASTSSPRRDKDGIDIIIKPGTKTSRSTSRWC